MNYIYDITLNFNEKYYDFYDWNHDDVIMHVRKIPIFIVDSNDLYKIKNNKVSFSNIFLDKIKNKTECLVNRSLKNDTCFLMTDCLDIIALRINKTIEYSSLLIDEELDILDELDYKKNKIDYKILSKKNNIILKTRNQLKCEKKVKEKIEDLIKENNESKIKYIYYEYFNQKENNIDIIKNSLKKITNYIKLYNIFKEISAINN